MEFPIIFPWVPLHLFIYLPAVSPCLPGVFPLRFLALMEPRTLLAAPDVGVCVFPKQRNEHTRQHKTRQTWRPRRTTHSALFYTVVCGMLPNHKTHCCFSDLSLTFWISKMFTYKQAPRVCYLQLAPLSSLFAGEECPASFASTWSSTFPLSLFTSLNFFQNHHYMLNSLGFGVCPLAPSPADCENNKSKNINQYIARNRGQQGFYRARRVQRCQILCNTSHQICTSQQW